MSELVAYWRIVPRRSAPDVYRRRHSTRDDAMETLTAIRKHNTYKIVAYNAAGKVVGE